MAERILGPTGSRRRKRFLLVPVLLVLCTALFVVAGAQAVHDAGVFQLDGNAQTSVQSDPTALEDWDLVCPATSPPSRPASDPVHCLGGTTASESVFIADGFEQGSDDIFKGGTDDADVNTWQWKQAKMSPDKADIEQAYAAQYTVTAAGPYQGHKVLYFGGTRLANDGNTNIGFWFFQNEVTTAGSKSVTDPTSGAVSCPVNSGCGFSGVHKEGNVSLGGNIPGDIFILSAFTNGGAQPTIKIFEWVGPGNATKDYLGSNNCFTSACTLQPLPIPLGPNGDNRCDPTVSQDDACALVNTTSTPSPWFFKDKTTGSPANTFGPAEFYEGGMDLTGLGFGEACFQSTLLNTRSSQSGTSILQDFAIGGFGECESELHTTPANNTGTPLTDTNNNGIPDVPIGAGGSVQVRDLANLTITGVSIWSGTLTFFLCGPLDAPATCTSGGTQVGLPITVTNATVQPIQSALATISTPGRYCWRGEFVATTTGVPNATDSSITECFEVLQFPTAITTRQFVFPQDKAVITTAGGGNLAGSVTFELYDTAANCAGGTATGRLYSEQLAVSGASPQAKTTSNTTTRVTSDTTVFWRVTYVSTNGAQLGSSSVCTEQTTVSYAGNDSGISIP